MISVLKFPCRSWVRLKWYWDIHFLACLLQTPWCELLVKLKNLLSHKAMWFWSKKKSSLFHSSLAESSYYGSHFDIPLWSYSQAAINNINSVHELYVSTFFDSKQWMAKLVVPPYKNTVETGRNYCDPFTINALELIRVKCSIISLEH